MKDVFELKKQNPVALELLSVGTYVRTVHVHSCGYFPGFLSLSLPSAFLSSCAILSSSFSARVEKKEKKRKEKKRKEGI